MHTLALAEELHRQGVAVEVIALGDPQTGFFRRVDAPLHLIPSPPPFETLEQRVAAAIDALTEGLRARRAAATLPHILHVQDCISARAAVRLRDEGAPVFVLRTVHHVDDFTTPDLIECQLRSILDPDRLLVVSRMWRDLLAAEYGVKATVVTDLPVFREYLTAGHDALVVQPGDDQDLAAQLDRLANDPALRAALTTAGRQVAARFTWSACASQHRAVYDEIL